MPDTPVTKDEIAEVAKDTADTVAAEFAAELGGDHGPNGPDISPDLLARMFARVGFVAEGELRLRAALTPPEKVKPDPEFEVE